MCQACLLLFFICFVVEVASLVYAACMPTSMPCRMSKGLYINDFLILLCTLILHNTYYP